MIAFFGRWTNFGQRSFKPFIKKFSGIVVALGALSFPCSVQAVLTWEFYSAGDIVDCAQTLGLVLCDESQTQGGPGLGKMKFGGSRCVLMSNPPDSDYFEIRDREHAIANSLRDDRLIGSRAKVGPCVRSWGPSQGMLIEFDSPINQFGIGLYGLDQNLVAKLELVRDGKVFLEKIFPVELKDSTFEEQMSVLHVQCDDPFDHVILSISRKNDVPDNNYSVGGLFFRAK
jgi:hypothetical protein